MKLRERLETCKVCEYRDKEICRRCGCLIKAKAVLPYAKCPVGRWAVITIKDIKK
jgi:hypothetical protein